LTFPNNIFQNNIIPVNPLSNKTDPSLSNYNCDLTRGQATPQNISTYPNFLNTGDAVNWLYFSDLRGGAKENLNVLYTWQSLATSKREGVTTVQQGGRFTYWNPSCGPGCWLVVDNQPQTVIAKTVNITLKEEMFPTTVSTFNATVYQLMTKQE